MSRKYYTDYEMLEVVKKWKVSDPPVKTFANQNGLNRETFRTWVYAYHDIEGRFVRLTPKQGSAFEDVINYTKSMR